VRQEKLEETLGYALSRSYRKYFQLLRKELSHYDLTPPQFGLLVSLREKDGLSQVKLGNILEVDRTTLTGILDRLEKNNFIMRKADPLDRRSKLIYLTERGRDCQEKVIPAAQEINRIFSEKLSPQELEQMLLLLKKVGN